MNKLQYETSPYLLQHAHNPVNWYAWKPEAFEKARAEDKPILVSIGYSTCHWCHVMERESFEDKRVAEYMNRHFVCIKVDREERPDVDQIYMEACQIISGSGGWPLNCFLLPDGRPFYAGTYYPPRPAYNRPSWTQLLEHLEKTYREQRQVVEDQARQLTEIIGGSDQAIIGKKGLQPEGVTAPLNPVAVQSAALRLRDQFDTEEGGFGGAPKFPGAMSLEFLFHLQDHQPDAALADHVVFSLEKMIRGGIYDQIGGGFARYTTDKAWRVPHFEKMLYDNALLVRLLAQVYRKTGIPAFKQAIEETLGFIDREMTHPEGAFYSALDADSEGVEGKFYVWTKEELEDCLGAEAEWVSRYFGVEAAGNWEHGQNILWRPLPDADFAENEADLARIKAKMLETRARRVRPGLDDKVLADWNGLMSAAYTQAYAALGDRRYLEAAEKNIAFLLKNLSRPEGGLYHTWKGGVAQYPAFLDDYAFLMEALLDLYQVGFDPAWLEEAERLARYALDHFLDSTENLFYFTEEGQSDILLRRKDLYDSALPSGNSTMALNLRRLGILTGRAEYTDYSEKMLSQVIGAAERYPSSFGKWLDALLWAVYAPTEVAVVGSKFREWGSEIAGMHIPLPVLMAAEEAGPYPLLEGRGKAGVTRIYLCRNYACEQPVERMEDFEKLLKGKNT